MPCARSTGPREGLYPVVCGKFRACHARKKSAKPLLAISLLEKGGVLGGLGICRGLPFCDSGSAGKTEIWRPDPGFTLQRPAVLFAKIGLWSGAAYFSPHFRNMGILAAIQVPYNAMQQGATLKIYFARSRFSLSSSRSTRELDALSSGMANVLGTIPTSDTVKSSFLTILLTIMVSKMVRIWVE